MIIWLNGAFGAGKTTAARELTDLLPGSRLFEPELAGASLRATLPKERLAQVDDVSELPSWRRLVVDTAAALLSEIPGPLIVPMTLLDQEHRDEIFGGLASRGIAVRHFLLHLEETFLRARIDRRTTTDGAATRHWCLTHLPHYTDALPWLTRDAHTLDTHLHTPRRTAEALADAIGRDEGTCPIVQTPPPRTETLAAGMLLFDDRDRVLLVDPTYKPGWEFPGGIVEPGEPPARAALREVAEELGLRLPHQPDLLIVDWEPPHPTRPGGLRLLFDGRRLTPDQIHAIRLPRDELRAWRFTTEDEARTLLSPNRHDRLHWALHARTRGRPLNLEAGVPVGT
ncbi:NUDIX domain-containing protein [Streptomyces carpaticus]|uniref:NUDIX hydrolase n=1 Tax=Streptomyces TaxID=1883 RepID=UPI001FF91984|nr:MULTISPECIES: NUDIX hydrolase [Streptomyces]MCK1817865.1 NUDIX domain-containing protein [Streptomyces sp. XM4011]UWM47529.1 NUDIX domain-containing protein [Streptomyces carpaticus]